MHRLFLTMLGFRRYHSTTKQGVPSTRGPQPIAMYDHAVHVFSTSTPVTNPRHIANGTAQPPVAGSGGVRVVRGMWWPSTRTAQGRFCGESRLDCPLTEAPTQVRECSPSTPQPTPTRLKTIGGSGTPVPCSSHTHDDTDKHSLFHRFSVGTCLVVATVCGCVYVGEKEECHLRMPLPFIHRRM